MQNKLLIEELKNTLADSYALYLKTQNYHWNVEGPNFSSLHSLFEQHYDDLAESIDEAAELIRGLGAKAPVLDSYIQRTSIKPASEESNWQQMVKELHDDNVLIQKTLQKTLEVSQKEGDEVVASFVTERLTFHRKAAWMLRSSL